MSDILSHQITVADIVFVGAVGVSLLFLFLCFVVLAVNKGWVR